MGAKVSSHKMAIKSHNERIRRVETVIQDDFENIGKAGQSKSTSAFAFRRNRGITTGLSMIGTPLMSPSKSDRTPLAGYNKPKGASPLRPSIMVESGDEKHDFNFPSLICKQSKPHIEDISSLRTFLGTDFFTVEPLSPHRYLRINYEDLEKEEIRALEAVVDKINAAPSKIKLYIHSQIPMDTEKRFEEKSYKMQVLEVANINGSRDNRGSEHSADIYTSKHFMHMIGASITSRRGISGDGFNQDNYFMYADNYSKIFIVADGHGPFGGMVSYFATMSLAKSLVEDSLYLTDTPAALRNAFHSCDKNLSKFKNSKNKLIDTALSGTSVTVAIVKDNKIYIAHLGNTKAMLGRRSQSKRSILLYPLTSDHVPSVGLEKKRIYESGGEVRKLSNSNDDKVCVRGRVFPGLSITRSLGDEVGKLIGVISKPDIVTYDLNPETDVFLLIGTDPFFSFLEDNEILNVLNFAGPSQVATSTEILARKAVHGWTEAGMNYGDITLALSYFSH